MKKIDLVYMMFGGEPIETFERLLDEGHTELEWGWLLHMSYYEHSYASVGGDYGYMENPPINYERIEYLDKLIDLLETRGIKEEKR